MIFMQKYRELKKQKISAWVAVNRKRLDITCAECDQKQDACMKIIRIKSLGVGDFANTTVQCCKNFCEAEYCTNQDCRMWRKNQEYINAVKLYKSIKQAQRQMIKDMLHLHKK